MKIAIHNINGGFSEHWIEYCQLNNITFKTVNCYESDIIDQLKGFDALIWHHKHDDYKDVLAAKTILFALQHAGLKVFPDFNTGWHFDDKVAQKYLFEALGAPLVPSFVFYDKQSAKKWAGNTAYPKVFKLTRGAGSSNVKLIRNQKEAFKKINTAFGKGFSQFDRWSHLKETFKNFKNKKTTLLVLLKVMGKYFIPREFAKMGAREKGYVYFQKFIPNNDFDIRIVVIGNKAAGEKRFVRKNDFRASGSGVFSYDGINTDVVQIAFDVSERLKLQSAAFDFIYDENKKPLIVEVSYGFGTRGISNAPGYWTSDLKWHEGRFNPQDRIIENLIASLNN